MDERQKNLSNYRIAEAEDSLKVAAHCLKEGLYKDSINRSYYAAFYAVKAILALSTVDFKRHKDVMGYFNKEYVAKEIFPREIGRKLGTLQRVREKSDAISDSDDTSSTTKKFNPRKVSFKDKSTDEVDPIQSNSNMFLDNDDAIVVNFKKDKK